MSTPFGHPMREHFLFSPNYTPLNHGSWGTYPKQVQDVLQSYRARAEASPDTFLRYDYPPLLDQSRQEIADLVHAPVEEIVLVPNTTTATNEVLRVLEWEEGDVIVYFEAVYGALEKTILYVCETTKAEPFKIEVAWPVSDEEVIRLFEEAVQKIEIESNGKRKVKLAAFDTICSMPGIRFPWEALVARCKSLNIYSLIDGAHGVGHIPLNLSSTQPDFFASNIHKWLFVPRACALFYVPLKNQHLVRSALPTSHGFQPLPSAQATSILNPLPTSTKGHFEALHEFVATLDNSAYLCIPAALAFRKNICRGEEQIMEYCAYVAREGGKKAAEILGTEVMDNKSDDAKDGESGTLTKNCAFANVRLPLVIGAEKGQVKKQDVGKVTQWIAHKAAHEYDTYFAVAFYRDNWWVRLSAQVYLEVGDFVWGAERLKELCERIAGGQEEL